LCSRGFRGNDARITSRDSCTCSHHTVTYDASATDAHPDDAYSSTYGTDTVTYDGTEDTGTGSVCTDTVTDSTCNSGDTVTDTTSDTATHCTGDATTDSTIHFREFEPGDSSVTVNETDSTAITYGTTYVGSTYTETYDADSSTDDAYATTDDAYTSTDADDGGTDDPDKSHYSGSTDECARVCVPRKSTLCGRDAANCKSTKWILPFLHRLCVHQHPVYY